MLEKTFALLEGIAPGTHVPADQQTFDAAELQELGHVVSRLVYAPSELRKRLEEHGVSIVPANFYSQIPMVKDLEASFETERTNDFDYIFDEGPILATLGMLTPYAREFNPPDEDNGTGYFWNNSQFSYSDAMSYYCMVRSRKPKRIVEIGSGFSTQVASLAVAANGFGEIICIEPFPRDFLSSVPHVTDIIRQPVQELQPQRVADLLGCGDILFIDSTHTVKHDSDCIHIYLRILPIVAADILVHAHDIFVPRSFSLQSMRDHQVHWTEQYLLYAYLIDNARTVVRFSSSYSHIRHKEPLDSFMHGRRASGGGSIWFDQSGKAPGHVTPAR